jgi:hypothetical protein
VRGPSAPLAQAAVRLVRQSIPGTARPATEVVDNVNAWDSKRRAGMRMTHSRRFGARAMDQDAAALLDGGTSVWRNACNTHRSPPFSRTSRGESPV